MHGPHVSCTPIRAHRAVRCRSCGGRRRGRAQSSAVVGQGSCGVRTSRPDSRTRCRRCSRNSDCPRRRGAPSARPGSQCPTPSCTPPAAAASIAPPSELAPIDARRNCSTRHGGGHALQPRLRHTCTGSVQLTPAQGVLNFGLYERPGIPRCCPKKCTTGGGLIPV